MRRVVLVTVIIAVLAGASGCATAAARSGEPAGPLVQPGGPPSSGVVATTPAPSERASIYVAMLRRYLTSGESSFPGTFPVVFILDKASADAAAPTSVQPGNDPIPTTDQLAIQNGLRDLGSKIVFVPTREEVMETADRCAQVRDGGILVTFAPVTGAKGAGTDRVEVGISGFVACLGATWFTYVVERRDGQWTATGITGPVAIA